MILRDTLPDAWEALPAAAGAQKGMVLALFPVAIAFTLLQLYWGLLIIQQIAKMVRGGGENDDEDGAEATEMISPRDS